MCAQPTAGPDGGGVSIILSPVQLAAVLEGQTVSDTETRTNRLWGAVTLLGGAIELVGAAALLLAPEPTMVTKVAGGALAVHGSDTVSTGMRQIWTGRPQTTLTAEAAAAACRSLGCDPDTAGKVGTAVDILVPLAAAAGVGAARLIAVRAGTIDLMAEEAAGGHTIAKHIGKTEAELRLRLTQEPRITAASSFRNLTEAEQLVSQAIQRNSVAIKGWAQTARAGDVRAFVYNAGKAVGQGVVRSTGKMQTMTSLRVVLQKTQIANKIYFVLTAYPIP
jgi:Bacterial CdiA-CT RNAse A domain